MMTWLEALVAAKGSDLHLKVGSPPRMRVDGRLVVLDGPHLTPDMAEELLRDLIRPDLHQQFHKTNEADFAYSLPGVGRFRVNAFRQRGSVGMVLRRVQEGAMSIGELGLPPVIARLAEQPRGLVLVTGPTGSGKTTTLAAMIDHVNANNAVHIVTIEDPIEVLHADKLGMVNQREVRVDTDDFHHRHAGRHAPGPRRHPGRRDPRLRDPQDLPGRRRDRPPGPVHPPHRRRRRDRQPLHRPVPALPAAPGAPVAGRRPARHRRPAPGPPGRRRRPRGRA
jgi:hypothetical protein